MQSSKAVWCVGVICSDLLLIKMCCCAMFHQQLKSSSTPAVLFWQTMLVDLNWNESWLNDASVIRCGNTMVFYWHYTHAGLIVKSRCENTRAPLDWSRAFHIEILKVTSAESNSGVVANHAAVQLMRMAGLPRLQHSWQPWCRSAKHNQSTTHSYQFVGTDCIGWHALSPLSAMGW